MGSNKVYLFEVIEKYQPRSLEDYAFEFSKLDKVLKSWARNRCLLGIYASGSRAKGTAISISSDVDYLLSLDNEHPATLCDTYESLYSELNRHYFVKQQNVSIRITLTGRSLLPPPIEIDITPGRKLSGNSNDHSLYVSKENSWKKTNIQKHINDIKNSGRIDEIKLLKIWRELNNVDFPSIYLEYLLVDVILNGKPIGKEHLQDNFIHILRELAKSNDNPLLTSTVNDPANTGNTLSDLLSKSEKHSIQIAASQSLNKQYLSDVVW
jgi:hypothetical protein